MKIVADENMPLLAELFGAHGEVVALPGRAIGPAAVRAADVLLVRSVTPVDAALLAGSRVRFVGSATSGCDHVDQPWLARAGIHFAHAPGCNAGAVVQYLLSAFCVLRPAWRELVVGIVGCGAVGGRLYRLLRGLGVRCLVSDPLLPATALPERRDLDAVLAGADILCLHVPLTRSGDHPTFHLLDAGRLARLKPGCLLINAARGAVVDNAALRRRLAAGAPLTAVLDVWEGEPYLDLALWQWVASGTPHIAGYSREGRENGTRAVHAAFCAWRGVAPPATPAARPWPLAVAPGSDALARAVLATFDVRVEHRRMAAALAVADDIGRAFDALRRSCPERREFGHFEVATGDPALAADLRRIGFAVAG
ncbi:MAG: erythronate-4-phosphate dehydrogenase [Porticoccaceae bacterium]